MNKMLHINIEILSVIPFYSLLLNSIPDYVLYIDVISYILCIIFQILFRILESVVILANIR